ncbi:MAG: hypothetical protein SynsKO_39780 [Synoicihabitans sp.]
MRISAENAPTPTFAPRVTPRLGPAFGGVLRMTWGQHWVLRNIIWATIIIAALALVGYLIGSRGGPQGYVNWVNNVLLMMSIPIYAFDAGARAIREDLKPGAVDYIITRPVPRWAYAIFKYISQWLVTATLAGSALGGMLLVGVVLEIPLTLMPRQIAVLVAAVTAFQALGFLLGSITSRYLLLGLLYAGIVEAAVGNIPLQLNNLSILRHLWVVLGGPMQVKGPAGQELALVFVIGVVLLGGAVLIFSRKQFMGKKSDDA